MARKVASKETVSLGSLLNFIRPRHKMILSTVRADGRPQMSPVTGGVDRDGRLVVSTYPSRAKTINAKRNPKVSVCVLSEHWNDAWVQIDGDAHVLNMPEAAEGLVDYFRCISGEHPNWDDYKEAMRVQNKSLIRIEITEWGPIATGGFPPHIAARLDRREQPFG